MRALKSPRVGAFICAVIFLLTAGVVQADDGVWINVSPRFGHYANPIGSDYDPCASQPPQTRTDVRMVDGTTRNDMIAVDVERRVNFELDLSGQAIQADLTTVTNGAVVIDRELMVQAAALPDNVDDWEVEDYAVLSRYNGALASGFMNAESDTLRTYEPTEQYFEVYCTLPQGYQDLTDDEGNVVDADGNPMERPERELLFTDFWVPLVTQAGIETELALMISQYLAPPDVDFLIRDPDTGWLFVKVPTEITVDGVAPVTLFANVSNMTGSVSASITATPVELIFDAGETGEDGRAGGVSCSWAEVEALECMYEYYNSSSIENDLTFETSTSIRWEVTTSAAGTAFYVTTASDSVQVAEFQAQVLD